MSPEERKEYKKQWRAKNRDKCNGYKRKYRKANRDKMNEYDQQYYEKYPWMKYLKWAKDRCSRSSHYTSRQIKCLLTSKEIKELWFRDSAIKLKKPSLDRKDPKQNYTFENCQFMEFIENIRKAHTPKNT